MKELDNVSFERCLTADKAVDPPMLCVFADASQEAFGACAYLRQRKDDNTYSVKFIAAKSRVALLKQLTIPRLELQAAVLATRLAKSIQDETRIQFQDAKFFTDSSITLAWIQSPSRSFKPFVSSRVGEIQSNSDITAYYKPRAQSWPPWSSNHDCKDKTKILDPKGKQAQQVCEVQVCYLSRNGSQGRNAVNGRASTSSPGTTDPTFSLHCLRLFWTLQCQNRTKQESAALRRHLHLS